MWKRSKDTLKHISALRDLLDDNGKLPTRCDLSRVGPLHLVSLYSEEVSRALVREDVYSGMDLDQDLAILKALVECAERQAFFEGAKARHPACVTPRSDGFAAYLTGFVGLDAARLIARDHALAEAVERYAWAQWWDNESHSFRLLACDRETVGKDGLAILNEIKKITPLRDIVMVQLDIDRTEFNVIIFFALLADGGVTTGGACAGPSSKSSPVLRALGELARHTEAARRLLAGAVPHSFYDLRLQYMTTARAGAALALRLSELGKAPVVLPSLQIDRPVPHALERGVAVHRCYFEDQPPFVGGALERLCL